MPGPLKDEHTGTAEWLSVCDEGLSLQHWRGRSPTFGKSRSDHLKWFGEGIIDCAGQ